MKSIQKQQEKKCPKQLRREHEISQRSKFREKQYENHPVQLIASGKWMRHETESLVSKVKCC